MASVQQAYLAAGGTVVLTGDPAAPGVFRHRRLRFPAPQPDGRGGWKNATRIVELSAVGTGAEIDAAIASLHRTWVRDAWLVFRATPTSVLKQARIIDVLIKVEEYDPLLIATAGTVEVSITLTTDPHWLGVWGSWTPTLVAPEAAGHFDIPAAGGDDDALVDLRIYRNYATNGVFVGGQPAPTAGFQYADSYSGSSMETDNTWKRYPGAPAINALANRGRYIPLILSSYLGSVASSTGIRSAVSTLGYNITATIPDVTGTNRTRDTQGQLVELPRITLPSAGIPESINGDSFTTKHHIEVINDNMYYFYMLAVYRIPVDYAAIAYRGALGEGEGIVYHGDTDTIHIADADGIGGSIMAAADIMRPLRAAPGAVTRMVFGHTAESSSGNTYIAYRVRPRYLTAAG